MIINVINYSEKLADDEIKGYIEEFRSYLKDCGINCENIEFIYYDIEVKNKVGLIISMVEREQPLLENTEFLTEVSDIIACNTKIVLIGENLKTKYCWGDAITDIAIIKNTSEKNLWHEIAHILGADDHYDENNPDNPKEKCQDNNCIMRYGKTDGVMCVEAIKEIRGYINSKK